jgi:hypothetical protein
MPTRTLRVTLEIPIQSLPANEHEGIAEIAAEMKMTVDECAASALSDAEAREVAACIAHGAEDPAIFGGSMLFQKVAGEARITSAEWIAN